MPAQFNLAVTTDLGRALIASSAGTQTAIEFTSMATGKGVYTAAQADPGVLVAATALKDQVQSFPISEIRTIDEYTAVVRAVLCNDDLASSYKWNEVGVFARLEGSGDTPILYAIAVIEDDGGEVIPAYSSTTALSIVQSFHLQVSGASSVTIEVTHSACELLEDAGLNADLETEAKDTLVNAINEVNSIVKGIARMEVDTVTVSTSDWSSSVTYADYPYRYAVSVTSMSADYFVDAEITSGAFADSWAVASESGALAFYVGSLPSGSLTFKYWYMKGE